MLLRTILRSVALDLMPAGSKEPPKEFRIFPMGDVPTSKGTFTFDHECGQAVMAAYRDQGNELHCDYEHQSLEQPPIKAPAAAWFNPELRSDGLWATQVRWTPEATKYLSSGEYRYFSPAFAADEDGRILRLDSCALTNLPATKNMQGLVACKVVPFSKGEVVDEPWDADGAEQRMRKYASKDGSGDKDQMEWGKYAMGFGLVGGEGQNFGDYSYPHHDVKAGKLVVSKRGVEAAAAAADGARGAKVPEDELAGLRSHLADHYSQWGGTAPWHTTKNRKEMHAMKSVLIALGLSETSTEAEAQAIAQGLVSFQKDVLAIAGKPTASEAKGVLEAHKQEALKAVELRTDLDKIKSAQAEVELNALVESALKSGKLVPAQKDWAMASGRKDPVSLKSYLDATPANKSSGGSEQRAPTGEQAGELTTEEIALCAKTGTDPVKFKEYKLKNAKA
jgi:phage I-like protein